MRSAWVLDQLSLSRISSSLALDTGATTANQPDFERHSNPSFFPTITGIV